MLLDIFGVDDVAPKAGLAPVMADLYCVKMPISSPYQGGYLHMHMSRCCKVPKSRYLVMNNAL